MPEIGEIKGARKLGYKGTRRHIWIACLDCGEARWVALRNGKPKSQRCPSCSNKLKSHPFGYKASNWKGGRQIDKRGYVLIRLTPEDFFYPMADSHNSVLEHRLVVAKALNRCLLPWEIVHHKGKKYPTGSKEDKQDNRYPENLQLLQDKKYHLIECLVKSHIKRQDILIQQLQGRITLLEAELVLLKKGGIVNESYKRPY